MSADLALASALDGGLGVIAEHGPFRLTSVAAIATGTPTFEQWELALTWCRSVERSAAFWVGDLLLLGEAAFGDLHFAALGADCDPRTQYDPETLANWKWVVHRSSANPANQRAPTTASATTVI
jgi:hypothetical protein